MKSMKENKGLVIYADDDPDDLFLISEAFLEHAPAVDLITVRNGLELFDCLKTLKSRKIDPCLIILDINMPGLDGRATLRKLRMLEAYQDLPVVLFTTSASNSDRMFAENFNAGFVTKPLTTNDYKPIIETFFKQCSEEVQKQYSIPVQ